MQEPEGVGHLPSSLPEAANSLPQDVLAPTEAHSENGCQDAEPWIITGDCNLLIQVYDTFMTVVVFRLFLDTLGHRISLAGMTQNSSLYPLSDCPCQRKVATFSLE
jgi:hypothetical protein